MGGFRQIVLAGALLLLCGGQVGAQEPTEADTTGEQATTQELPGAAVLAPALQGIEAAVRDLVPEPDDATRERQEKRKIADLDAQTTMARWAFPMFVATALSVGVTAIGVVLVWFTLGHTRRAADAAAKAVEEAKNATRAAEETVEVTRRIGMEQLRAYVSIGNVTVADFRVGKAPVLYFTAVNVGQTPAFGYQQISSWRYVSDPETAKLNFNSATFSGPRTTLGNTTSTTQETETQIITESLEEEVFNKTTALVFFGLVRYRDIFRRRRYASFRYYLDPSRLKNGAAELSLCRKHNGSN